MDEVCDGGYEVCAVVDEIRLDCFMASVILFDVSHRLVISHLGFHKRSWQFFPNSFIEVVMTWRASPAVIPMATIESPNP